MGNVIVKFSKLKFVKNISKPLVTLLSMINHKTS